MKRILRQLSLISAFYIGFSNLQVNANSNPDKSILEQSNSFFASATTSLINPDENDNKFVIYINQGVLNIKYNKPSELLNGEVVIFNLLGQEITRKKLESITINQVTLTVQNTCYIVKINYSGKVHTQKVVSSAQ